MVFTGTGTLDVAFDFIGEYIFGSPEIAGLFLLTFVFIGFMMLRVEWVLGAIATVPLNVVLYANGMISPLGAGLHILLVFIFVGVSFFREKT